ncbi:metallophosphoesterase family protein [Paenibacillus sp. JJ-223]|uniref:metallophosphoesterase family protein n=1 Tax=Paenibacillus sp. JJ-223 TaxID=2905647 RepID=UPI001F37F04F|nr:metallophosphoesterase family protein [Paenibacillus sp. JJ-223]CAH1207373.1 hypothetical protein PAECIP111890_02993 [Paenibacillus sp. JJ-223]
MKTIAVISDIHGNHLALEAVLQDIAKRDADLVVNLGDSLFGPIDPLATAKLLMGHEHMIHIMGNCDELLLKAEHESLTHAFVRPLLDETMLSWIGTFQATWSYEELLFCHGTPWLNHAYLLEKVTPDGVHYKDADRLEKELDPIPEKVVFCGHSHVFKSLHLPGGKMVVNAGSVGLPAYEDEEPYPHVMESGTPYAEYVLAHRQEAGNWVVEHVLVEYDWEQASRIALQNGREDYAFALRTGKAKP